MYCNVTWWKIFLSLSYHMLNIFSPRKITLATTSDHKDEDSDLFEKEANYMANGCTVIVADERALLFTVKSDRSAMILDSHSHGNYGAVFAHSKPGDVRSLALWLNGMMQTDWQYTLAIASAHKVMYN